MLNLPIIFVLAILALGFIIQLIFLPLIPLYFLFVSKWYVLHIEFFLWNRCDK